MVMRAGDEVSWNGRGALVLKSGKPRVGVQVILKETVDHK